MTDLATFTVAFVGVSLLLVYCAVQHTTLAHLDRITSLGWPNRIVFNVFPWAGFVLIGAAIWQAFT